MFQFTPTQLEWQRKAREMAAAVMAPRAAETDRTEQYPWEVVHAMRDAADRRKLVGFEIAEADRQFPCEQCRRDHGCGSGEPGESCSHDDSSFQISS